MSRITGRALVMGWGASLLDYKDPKNWVFNFGFGMREQALPPPPEPKRVTSRLLAFDFECASGLPLPLLGGMSLYGISGLWASRARPALGGGHAGAVADAAPAAVPGRHREVGGGGR